ncbi:zinc transporter 1a [Triplophysa rosa]|uniref:Zinc transporter 1 n=1 Tax=Triplophysa rosa TaxID=992332 RepID=A0A9W7TPX7_TRIRA|nr:zinc transporter 1a [Triplophysa rosa]KAI7800032.1 zinc transporter 1 [Triplophysa rosa]
MACAPNRARLLCMLSLTFGFFIVEVVVSRLTSSLAMLSDSFHMLSDVIALVVALVAVRFAEKTESTNKNTFGWIRAEVMGALVNAVFLTALCFTIILEAIERFTGPQEIEKPVVVIGVGAAGLLVNLLGLCLFHGHGGGGGHGHSHGGHSHGEHKKHKHGKARRSEKLEDCHSAGEETNNLVGNHNCSPNGVNPERRTPEVCHSHSPDLQINGSAPYEDLSQDTASQLNMRGVFLHVLGDALGSVIVVVNSLIFTFVWKPCEPGVPCENPCAGSHCTDHLLAENTSSLGTNHTNVAGPCWVLYLDPTLCVIMVCILMYTTYPLLKESALILLQTVPKQIDMHQLNVRLRDLEGILAVHELHIWQLAGSRIIATAHIKCHDPTSYMDVAKRIKDFFHNEGIHATTIQPEFVTMNSESRASLCELSCRTQCAPKLCCGAVDSTKQLGEASEQRNATESKTPTATSVSATTSLEIISESVENTIRPEAEAMITRDMESSL